VSSSPSAFLERPGQPGPFGALLDEQARAAADFCAVVETLPLERFLRRCETGDPELFSLQAVCAHVVAAAYGHASAIRTARRMAGRERPSRDELWAEAPGGVRPRLAREVRFLEETVAGLTGEEAELEALRFQVRWGPTYDPEMMLEHTIVHLLRHRRQIERWPP
jgi:uncharacterized damage-inducible protein DinB